MLFLVKMMLDCPTCLHFKLNTIQFAINFLYFMYMSNDLWSGKKASKEVSR